MNLVNLSIRPPLNSTASFTLSVRATSTNSASDDTATNLATIPVTVMPAAHPHPLDGGPQRVNSYTPGDQVFFDGEDVPRQPIATWDNGNYIIVWTSAGKDGSGAGIFAQKYDASGNPLGGEIQINVFTAGEQRTASVATLDDGSFVVTWRSFGQVVPDGYYNAYYSYWDVFARHLDSSGVGGAEVHVNTFRYTDTSQSGPSITVLSEGDYLIAWHSPGRQRLQCPRAALQCQR